MKFRPRKAAELEAVISGQAVPIVRKGMFSYSGIVTGSDVVPITAGVPLYAGANGILTTEVSGNVKVATALGDVDARGVTVILLNVV